ncbi:MAG: hypothetical protein U9Q82_02995 [Chloroflexota bacterium]|nr:hypothetical protein [Chloroflexota bacterium]
MNAPKMPPFFIPAPLARINKPLARYLPPLPGKVAASWLEKNIPRGELILDPFGAAPSLAVAAARSGYRLIVAANNPVLAFILKIEAAAARKPDLQAALATLSSTRIRDTRLEPHIQSLYQTQCHNCGRSIIAEAYLWEKDSTVPYGRIYTCPHCKDSGEYPTTTADETNAASLGTSGLHRSRALERVAPLHDPDRTYAEEALDTYPDRAVYVLGTLINKLNGLTLPNDQRELIAALLLTAFDQANTLWPHPIERERPKQLTVPPKYRENNIWLALEQAIDIWASDAAPIPLTQWPETPPTDGGICIFEGRIKALAAELADTPIAAVLTTFPRPNQAFWTLSALWSGWLWGAEAVEPIKAVLRRERYNWRWHTTAIHTALDSLVPVLPSKIPCFGLIGETEPGFLSAAMIAAHQASLELRGIAMRPEVKQTQLTWVIAKETEEAEEAEAAKERIRTGAKSYLEKRAEPSVYLPVLAAGLAAYFEKAEPHISPAETFDKLQEILTETLSYRGGFLHLGSTGKSPQTGWWWLQKHEQDNLPLSDRVEMTLVRYLLKHPKCTLEALDEAVCAALPGLLTPKLELIQVCLESYGKQHPPGSGLWQIRTQDKPAARRVDLSKMAKSILALGKHFEFETIKVAEDPRSFQWYDTNGEIHYTLYLTASAVLGKITQLLHSPLNKALIVLPGGRSNLVAYKLDHNPVLNQFMKSHCQLVKYRHLRYLVENPILNLANLDEQLGLDPLTFTEPQIRLL